MSEPVTTSQALLHQIRLRLIREGDYFDSEYLTGWAAQKAAQPQSVFSSSSSFVMSSAALKKTSPTPTTSPTVSKTSGSTTNVCLLLALVMIDNSLSNGDPNSSDNQPSPSSPPPSVLSSPEALERAVKDEEQRQKQLQSTASSLSPPPASSSSSVDEASPTNTSATAGGGGMSSIQQRNCSTTRSLPLHIQAVHAYEDIVGRMDAVKSLIRLCETVHLPHLRRGTSSSEALHEVDLFHSAVVDMKHRMFSLKHEVLPAIHVLLTIYGIVTQQQQEMEEEESAKAPVPSKPRPPAKGASRTATNSASVVDESLVLIERVPSLVELPVDMDVETLNKEEVAQIADEIRQLRELQEYANTLVGEHSELLESANTQVDSAHVQATQARVQLSKAAKLKIAGAALTGALVGGLVGGPVGMLAGAKSAASIGLAAVVGSATGGVLSDAIVGSSLRRVTNVEKPA